jgi:hypothetical protein|tara:strand:+ start:2865 stop:2990 length:126 start_codon:yes stop_codon:yes gene_type:complete
MKRTWGIPFGMASLLAPYGQRTGGIFSITRSQWRQLSFIGA